MQRRTFLKTSTAALAVVGLGGGCEANISNPGITWGAFNRMFRSAGDWPAQLDALRQAGFSTIGLTTNQARELAIRQEHVDDDRANWRQWLDKRNMAVAMARHNFDLSKMPKEAAEESIPQMDAWRSLGVRILWFTGTGRQEQYQRFTDTLRYFAEAAEERDMELHIKPHGGITTSGGDCVRLVEAVDSPAVRISYDPGNIMYYDGLDPVEELRVCLPYVSSVCVKDCIRTSADDRDVLVTAGDGMVDFHGVFGLLKEAGFAGPCIIETFGGSTIEEVTTEAARAKTFLQQFAPWEG